MTDGARRRRRYLDYPIIELVLFYANSFSIPGIIGSLIFFFYRFICSNIIVIDNCKFTHDSMIHAQQNFFLV